MIKLSDHAGRHPLTYLGVTAAFCIIMLTLVLLPSLWPTQFSQLHSLRIDTDPENMLDADEPVRLLHNAKQKDFALNDMIVVGVINEQHPQGVFNAKTLGDVYELAQFALNLHWQENGKQQGVVEAELITPSTVDTIEQAGMGAVKFDWLLPGIPESDEQALAVAERAMRIPFFRNSIVSDDGKSLALYIPLTEKNVSYRVASELKQKIASFNSQDEYHVTGLPIAQDQFGVEMFKQMAISAPSAMLLIFALMWFFFRNWVLILAPLLVALVAVIGTMGLLITSGYTVHIMSSMIPIFIMPIAVLDAVHILSDFFDRYDKEKGRREVLNQVMQELSKPMLFTSITTCIGFASLALTPIPPVQVFGLFVALGVLLAWLVTITLVPAFIMRIPEASFEEFGLGAASRAGEGGTSGIHLLMDRLRRFSTRRARTIVLLIIPLLIVAGLGMSKIEVNDNPIKWFAKTHELQIADKKLNARFAGTYMAYLALDAELPNDIKAEKLKLTKLIKDFSPLIAAKLIPVVQQISGEDSVDTLYRSLVNTAREQMDQALTDEEWESWQAAEQQLESLHNQREVFKNPQVLEYVAGLQQGLLDSGLVGKSNALPDIVKTVHRELYLGDDEAFRIPQSQAAVAQTLMTYESSHRPGDLWHFVSHDFQHAILWIQLKSGDNRDMQKVVNAVDQYLENNPAPILLKHDWFGLTYINLVWQQKMVVGMLAAFAGSFVVVLIMLTILFRSFWWGLLGMLPLTVAITLIYGVIGFIGKDYDMPVAILSSLSIGLAVDYAIHFIVRARQIYQEQGNWKETSVQLFGEPARAISRNIIIIGCGFLPLLAAPLVPYKTVGVLISSILLVAGAVSLILLPALITLFEKHLFKKG